MKCKTFNYIRKALLFAFSFALTALSTKAQTTLFDTPFDATYNNTTLQMPYRIPALVETENATTGNKELIFFGDKRYCGMDIGYGSSANAFVSGSTDYYRIDIVSKRSTDGGKSWGAETIVKQGTATCGYGDIAVVSNRENQKQIVAFAATGNVRYSNTSSNIQITRLYSNNGGQSWTSSDYTSNIYGIYSGGYGRFFTSGRICQSKQIKVGDYYRLYAALCVWNGSSDSGSSNALVIYSDDFGSSWNVLGSGYAVSGGDESKVEELPNGNVLISSRIYDVTKGYDSNGRRRFNVFKYNTLPTSANTASGSWGTVYSGIQYTGTPKSCNGEILLVPAKDANGNSCNILLHSEPYGTTEAEGRGNVSIFWKVLSSDKITSASEFAGTNWNRFPVSTTTSAYSTMIQQHDGTIAFAYEETIWGNGSGAPSTSINKITWGEHGYDLKYRNFTIADITENQYTYDAGEEEEEPAETIVETPVISPNGGEFNGSTTFTITCGTSGATIYYTTDGSEPSASNGLAYDGKGITLDAIGTYRVKAIAIKSGLINSTIATASFTIKPELATITKYRFKNIPVSGNTYYYFAYDSEGGLTLTTDVNSAHLYTRTTVNETKGIYNFQSEDGNYLILKTNSTNNNKGYNDDTGYLSEYKSAYCDLTVTSSTSINWPTGAVSIAGQNNNGKSCVFTIANGNFKYQTTAVYSNRNGSSAFIIEEVKEEVEKETVATPVISPNGGTYTNSIEVSITCETPGATIYYTTDGTDPSVSNGAAYTTPFVLNEAGTYTVKSIAVKTDCNNSDIATSEFTIEQMVNLTMANITCNESGCTWATYSTLYLDYAVKIPSGVVAYRGVLNGNNTELVLYKIRNGIVPANYAVIIIDTNKSEMITLSKTTTEVSMENNSLEGTLVDITGINREDYYVLGHTSANHVAFYHPKESILKANKAYLPRPTGVSEIKVRWADNDATGITGIETDEQDAIYYDLMGRRVTNPTKGIYIKNGKKVLFR